MDFEKKFRNKINWIFFICSIFVVFIHSYSYVGVSADLFAYDLEYFISENIAQSAVPTFFAVSGFLFYRNFDLSKLKAKWGSRFHSLVIPYLIWNTIYFVVFFFISKFSFVNTEVFSINSDTIVDGVLFYRHNYNFWFVFHLIILTACCPVIYGLLKNRWIAIGFFITLVVLYGFDVRAFWKFETRAIIYYFLGAYCAVYHQKDIVNHQKVSWVGAFAFATSQILIYSEYFELPIVYIVARLLMIVAVFDISNLVIHIKLPRVLLCSFPIYALHGLILEVFNKVFSFVLAPDSNWILLDYFGSAIITVIIIVCINEIMIKYMPKVHKLLFGGR